MSLRNTRKAEISAMTIAEAASYWFVRHDADDMSTEEKRIFADWLVVSSENREAYERTQSTWASFEVDADQTELRALRTAALSVTPEQKRWPQMAAAVALYGVAAVIAIRLYSPHPNASNVAPIVAGIAPERYVTARNERSTVTLADGTLVTLNLDTALDVAFTEEERLVRITHGQAFFEVAKNPNRPFVVAAADRRVTALGTQFDVRLDPDRIEVVLLEGKITVDHATPSLLESVGIRKAHVELHPGQKLVAALGEPVAVTDTNAQRATSWREGWVVFEGETVADAVAELNRYSEHTILVPDESVRRLKISGVFRVGQPDRFTAIIQELLPVKVVQNGQGETLLIRAEESDDPKP
jgi:transmembrane sensor